MPPAMVQTLLVVAGMASFVQPPEPVLHCPVVVYEDGSTPGPHVVAYRDGAPAEGISYRINKSENVILDVHQKEVDCKGITLSERNVRLPYRRYELELYGVELGDKLTIDSVTLAPLAGGACPVLDPLVANETLVPDCTVAPPSGGGGGGTDWSDSDAPTDENLSPYGDDMNCNAGGPGSLVVALALLAVVGRRRRVTG